MALDELGLLRTDRAPGRIQLEGDTAVGRSYVSELGHMRAGRSELNYAVCDDLYRRPRTVGSSPSRIYEVRYLDTTPRAGSAPASEVEPGRLERVGGRG